MAETFRRKFAPESNPCAVYNLAGRAATKARWTRTAADSTITLMIVPQLKRATVYFDPSLHRPSV